MSITAIGLVLVSAFIHASWNVMARHSRAETTFISGMLPILAIGGLIPALIGQVLTGTMTAPVWPYVILSGLSCGFYFLALGHAYEAGDFTTVYPVARSLPVLIVGIGDSLRGMYPTPIGWLGMAFVVAGCMISPLRNRRDISWRRYFNRASLWMVLTALGTVAYSLLDKRGSELLRRGPVSALVYCYFFYLFAYVGYLLFSRLLRDGRNQTNGNQSLLMPTIAGLMSFAGYFLVLWAFQMVPQASYIVAFRQSSLVIAVLMAFGLYREERHWARLVAVLIITAGLLLISLYG